MSYQAGWYADPTGRFDHRYFDGTTWTENVSQQGTPTTDALNQPAPAAAPAAPDPVVTAPTAPEPAPVAAEPAPVAAAATPEPAVPAVSAPAVPAPAAAAPAVAAPAVSAVAAPTAQSVGAAIHSRKGMSLVMMGCAAIVFIAAFLPWVTTQIADDVLNGFSWGPGKVTALMAIGLGLYAAQGLMESRARVQFHPWVVAILSVTLLTAVFANETVETADQATFGLTGAEAGWGLNLTFLFTLVAVWPLVILWRADKRQLREAAAVVSPVAPTT